MDIRRRQHEMTLTRLYAYRRAARRIPLPWAIASLLVARSFWATAESPHLFLTHR